MTSWKPMSNSSENSPSVFSGLRLQQVNTLIDVLRETVLTTHEHIERIYLEQATHFNETLFFLKEIGLVSIAKDHIAKESSPIWELDDVNDVTLVNEIIHLILKRNTRYRREVFEYLNHFRITGGIAHA